MPARSNPSADAAAEAKRLWITNVWVIGLTIVATLWAILGHEPGQQRIDGTRGMAVALIALYGAAHAIMVLRARIPEAGRPARPRDANPLRISCLDLAVYWLLIFVLAPWFL